MNYNITIISHLLLSSLFYAEAFVCAKNNNLPRSSIQQLSTQFSTKRHVSIISNALKDGNNVNNDDFDDFSNDEIEAANDLAKEFYQQMKKREQEQLKQLQRGNEETWEMKNQSSSSSDQTTTADSKKKIKFTGRFNRGDLDGTGTPSAGLFATQNGTVYAMPAQRRISIGGNVRTSSRNSDRLSPREQMMRREFNLVSLASNELTLIVQGVLVLVILTFAIYIGASGGITDGSDRFGTAEGYINEYNGLGESLDYSSYTNDGSSIINNQIIDGLQKKEHPSVWL